MSALTPTVSFVRVSKRFGSTSALRQITLAVHPGELACVLGPNGSGKSTLLALAAGLGRPTQGEVRIRGVGRTRSMQARRRGRIGYLPQDTILYEQLTGLEHLTFMAQLADGSDGLDTNAEDAFRAFGLNAQAHRRIARYSPGMRRKVALLAALVHTPDMILLDEPLAGLDPPGIRHSTELLGEARQRGACILVATHRPDAFAGIADRWLCLQEGRLVHDGVESPVSPSQGAPDGDRDAGHFVGRSVECE